MMQNRFHRFVFLCFLIILQGCSSTFEERQPETSLRVQEEDTIIVRRPENSTIDSGRSFNDLLESEQVANDSDFLVTAFPRAGERAQDALASILEQEEEEFVLLGSDRTGVRIPYRFSPDQSDLGLRVLKSDQVVSPDNLDPTDSIESSADVVISGHVENGFVGMGPSVENRTNKHVPDDHALFRVETVWRIHMPDRGTSETVRINDEELVNFYSHPDPVKRFYRLEKTFHQLLRRVAWRVASRLVPHQYDTSFGKEDE
jgi:hypothetical protein